MEDEKLIEELVKRYASNMLRLLTEIRKVDIPYTRYVLEQAVSFERPLPALRAAANLVAGKYNITLSGYRNYKFDLIQWSTTFLGRTRSSMMQHVDGLHLQLSAKEPVYTIQMRSSQEQAKRRDNTATTTTAVVRNSTQARANALGFVRAFIDQKADIVRALDTPYIERVMLEAMVFEHLTEDHAMKVGISMINGIYNITVGGYRNTIDLMRWCNIFVGEHRNDMLRLVDSLYVQQDPGHPPVMLIQVQPIALHSANEYASEFVVREVIPEYPADDDDDDEHLSRSHL